MRTENQMWQRLRRDESRARLAKAAVGFALDVRLEDSPERGSNRVSRARKIAMYLTHTAFGISLHRVALAFERDRSTVAAACHAIEDDREDAEFDRMLIQIETALTAMPMPVELAALA